MGTDWINFLVTRSADQALDASHNTGLSNFLALANNRLPKNLQCDYIFVASSDNNNGEFITSPVIATYQNRGKVSFSLAVEIVLEHCIHL